LHDLLGLLLLGLLLMLLELLLLMLVEMQCAVGGLAMCVLFCY